MRAKHVLTPEDIRALRESENRPPAYFVIPFFGVFVAIGGFAFGAGLRSKTVFPLIFGALFGGLPLTMSLVPAFNAPFWIIATLGAVMMAWGYAKGRSLSWTQTLRGPAGSTSSGWIMGSSGSSGGSWSSGGGGGFGGGSSGGGGASGSW